MRAPRLSHHEGAMADIGWFAELLKETLSGVGFFEDYVQLHFNLHPLLNIYSSVLVTVDGAGRASGEPGFADALLGQMRKKVADVQIEAERCIAIRFKDGSAVSFSTKPPKGSRAAFTLFTAGGAIHEE